MTMRERSLIGLVGAMFFLLAVGIGGMYFADAAVATDFTAKISRRVLHIHLAQTGWGEICLQGRCGDLRSVSDLGSFLRL